MKYIGIIILSLFFSLTAFGQNINDSLLAAFYNKVLEASFNYDGISCGNRNAYKYIIKTDFDTARLIKIAGYSRLVFYKEDESFRGLLLRPWEKNKGRTIYRISHIVYNNDSIDVNLASWVIVSITRKNMALGLSCGGILGYIPDARFVYNKETMVWKYMSADDLIKQRLPNRNKQ